jgi:uncharacterized membrane protein
MTRLAWPFAIGLTLAVFLASVWLYPALPERIPTHWGIRGEVDGYGSKSWALFLMPSTMAGMMVFFAVLPWLSPKRFEVDSFRPTYLFIMLVVMGLFAYIHGLMLYAARFGPTGVGKLLVGGIFLMLALMGVRTPWTLASERVWTDTHRLAAWLFVAAGLLGFLLCASGYMLAAFVLLITASLVPVAHSLWLYKRLERRGEL